MTNTRARRTSKCERLHPTVMRAHSNVSLGAPQGHSSHDLCVRVESRPCVTPTFGAKDTEGFMARPDRFL